MCLFGNMVFKSGFFAPANLAPRKRPRQGRPEPRPAQPTSGLTAYVVGADDMAKVLMLAPTPVLLMYRSLK